MFHDEGYWNTTTREKGRDREGDRDKGTEADKNRRDMETGRKEGREREREGERERERERVLELETATLVDGYLMFRWTCLQPALAVYYKYISTFRRCNCANCLRIFTFTRHPN